MITDKSRMDYDVPIRVQQFLDSMNNQASFTKGKNLMLTMGSGQHTGDMAFVLSGVRMKRGFDT